MSLLLLFAGGGVQAPAPPDTGPICGTVSSLTHPKGLVTQTKVIGVVDAAILDKVMTIAIRPQGSIIPIVKPSGVVTSVPVGSVSQQSRPSGDVDIQDRPHGTVSECE